MSAPETTPSGLFASIRRLASTFLAILHNRLELASVEARQETRRLMAILIAGGVAIACIFLGMIVLTFFFVVAFWPWASWVLMGFTIFYLGIAVAALWYMRKRFKEPLFPETISQLKKDRQWLLPGS